MRLQNSWIDALFARLSVRYGAAFLRQWPDADPEIVKADWAQVLGGFSGEAIRYALEHLPADKPPTAGQFRLLCNAVPVAAPIAITHDVKADPERVAELMANVKQVQQRDPKGWAKRLQRIELEHGGVMPNGLRMTRAAREMWRTALGVA